MVDNTTIKLSKKTKQRLDKLKVHKRDTYEETIQKLLSILNSLKGNPLKARSELNEIDKIRRALLAP
jgi:mRNA-degrading endonuclease RelE of RelBE toxin-antitoxin system